MSRIDRLWPAGPKPAACEGCPHGHKRQPFVPGFGEFAARLILVGEKPGKCEEGKCDCAPRAHPRLRPFVGKSGKRIDVGLGDREGCFITNVRKCNATDASKEERAASIAHCVRAYLQPEMDAVDAAQRAGDISTAGVCAVGADAAGVLLGRASMAKLHGTFYTRAERDAMVAVAESLAGRTADSYDGAEDVPF